MSIMKEESEVAISQDGRLTPFNASLLERPTGDVWSPYRVIACYDTEYCSHDGFDPDIDPTRVNFLLSMQLSLFVRRGRDQWEYLEEFKLPDGDRPKLAQLTGWALDLAGIPRRSKKSPYRFCWLPITRWPNGQCLPTGTTGRKL